MLLLLDCCAAGTACTDNGHGVTELLGACAFKNTANGVGEFSFTVALCEELKAFSRVPSFTVSKLYSNLLRRTQLSPSHMTLQKAPVHVVLTQDYKLPRSIQLSPLPREPAPADSVEALLQELRFDNSRLGNESRDSASSKVCEADAGSFSPGPGSSSRTSLFLDDKT